MRLKTLEVKNYRTLENVIFNFNGYYAAICGKNNSGKSNLIRALRLLFGEKERYSPFREDIELSYKSDFTAWKKNDAAKGIITIAGEIEVNKDADQGLVGFVESIDSEKTGLTAKGDWFLDVYNG